MDDDDAHHGTDYLRGEVGDFLKILARLTTLFVRTKWITTCVRTRTRVWSPVIIPRRQLPSCLVVVGLDFQTSSTEFGPSSSRPVALSDATREPPARTR